MSSQDEELLKNFRNPKLREKAFRQIVSLYKEQVYWHSRRMVHIHEDAEDLTQDIFVKVYKALPKFKGQSELYTWIYRIATNTCINFLQKKKKTFMGSEEDYEFYLMNQVAHADHLDANEIEEKLLKAISTLPEKQKAVFNLRYYDEMKFEDISKVLETSVGALKASYHHAAKKIENYLNEN